MNPPMLFTLRATTPACYGGEHHASTSWVGPAILTFPKEYVLWGRVHAVMMLLYAEHVIQGRQAVTWTADMASMN